MMWVSAIRLAPLILFTMKEIIYNILSLIVLGVISYLFINYLFVEKVEDIVRIENSSPVEELHHRQLVITIDSILDSRYPCGVTEDDTAYPFIDSLSSIAVPNNK